jgi:2,4-dienoyl-CoA reductase-like NADH-dependent reductase (Old Yellow Enzyme family)
MISLLDPIQIGEIHLPNRVIMSPLTRLRGTPEHIPTQLMVEYYAQRAGAGLIISEGIPVVPQGVGYANVPGIWSTDQIEAWKLVTKGSAPGRGPHFCANLACGPHLRPVLSGR